MYLADPSLIVPEAVTKNGTSIAEYKYSIHLSVGIIRKIKAESELWYQINKYKFGLQCHLKNCTMYLFMRLFLLTTNTLYCILV